MSEFKKVKLQHHQSAQCYVLVSEDTIQFISYTTLVIEAAKAEHIEGGNKWLLECTGTHSQTTRKQIGYFLKEYFDDVDYYQMKDIVGTGKYVLAEKKHAKFW
jgi:uncharacterized protein YgbK (DUF1537 family)